MVVIIFFAVRWIRRQLAGQELLELRSTRILSGERGPQVRGSVYEWPASTSSALDMLLSELQFASDQRSRMDTLIRSYAAQDSKTGLNNRLFLTISWPRCWKTVRRWEPTARDDDPSAGV